ncbi:MAG: cystathionine gamma-lyase [Sutterellaceae bacterium]|nr:cystathionine gamma-lyase [Burkholderiaceae bacterium]MDW8430180.1 cystathionine gamma-lyase [Sutterellaceae bacterium]
MSVDDLDRRFARALHGRTRAVATNEPLTAPIVATSVYQLPGDPSGPYQYGRWSNPTWSALEAALSELEEAQAIVLPSGMAAVAAVYYALLQRGARVLLPANGYYATRALAERFLAPFGVQVATMPTTALAQADLTAFDLVWIETPSNPGLALVDIAAVAERAHRHRARVVVDNTTMTPLGQQPLALGADVVVYSDTKTINGHADVLLGHVATRDPAVAERIRQWRMLAGAIPGPFEAWLVLRGLETLEVRFERMCANAALLAERLATHPRVQSVLYPGLAAHPQYELACRQMRRFGSLIGLTFADAATADAFIAGCHFVRTSTSFGSVHTAAERRARWGDTVAPGFVRLSVGCEPPEALWQDLQDSLARL